MSWNVRMLVMRLDFVEYAWKAWTDSILIAWPTHTRQTNISMKENAKTTNTNIEQAYSYKNKNKKEKK